MTYSRRPVLLDLFCKAGGATKGYQQSGFYVVGVDIEPQPHYCGDEFHQADAITYPLKGYDAYHASPPCQPYTLMAQGLLQSQNKAHEYPKLIEPIRALLVATGKPYVIENVPGAPLIDPIRLCGSSFGLKVQRHRLFECNFPIMALPCAHYWQGKEDLPPLHRLVGHSRVIGVYGNGRGKGDNLSLWSEGMGITWMTRKELSQAIPPAYTKFIGKYLMVEVLYGRNTPQEATYKSGI
ncbi:MAG: hypothetical protein A2Z70_01395 [Chloroflexi bacterium RBG_13_48_17]|nr:MAG: hypothetical protein A2Z70_01395 [Chloroflexi bacterium RBG_13_48_17]